MNRNRYNVLWAPGKAGDANDHAKAHGLKHIPYDQIDEQTDWRVYELPPGIARKQEKWIRAHPHFGGVFEAESFGDVDPVLAESGGPQAVVFDEWYQKFLNVSEAHSVTRGAGAVGGILDNGFNAGVSEWLNGFITEALAFCTREPGIVTGGSHGMPVMGLAKAVADLAAAISYKIGTTSDVTCSWTDVSNAALDAKKRGLKVLNLSYGSTNSGSSLLSSTLKTLYDAGIAVIVAAGNSSGATAYPANNQYAFAVSALDNNGGIAGFSCRGKIDISTPGVSLLTSNNAGGWSSFSGTSGAAPLAFGVVLLILAMHPDWTGVQAVEWMLSTAIVQSPATDYGKGWANAAKAVGAVLPAAPGVPTGLKVTEVTASSALLSVDPMSGPIGIEFDQGPGPYYVGKVVLPESYYRWTGLNEQTAYSVLARSYDYQGKSAYSARVNFKTLAITDPVTPPPDPEPDPVTPPVDTMQNITEKFTWVASSENPNTQYGPEKMAQGVDGSVDTKWLAFEPSPTAEATAIGGAAMVVEAFEIASANDYPQRDPGGIILKDSHGNDLFTATGLEWPDRKQVRRFLLPAPMVVTGLKFLFHNISGAITQMSEIRVLGYPYGTEPPPPPPPEELSTQTLAALAVIENDMLTMTVTQKSLLKTQLNRLLGML